jgi:hypothetical protein
LACATFSREACARAGTRVRITGQLIDALTGKHIWAERYDHELVDIFAVQDSITESIASAIEPKLLAAEGLRAESRSIRRPERLGSGRARGVAFLEADGGGKRYRHDDAAEGSAALPELRTGPRDARIRDASRPCTRAGRSPMKIANPPPIWLSAPSIWTTAIPGAIWRLATWRSPVARPTKPFAPSGSRST